MRLAISNAKYLDPIVANLDRVAQEQGWEVFRVPEEQATTMLLNNRVELALFSPLGYASAVGTVDYRIIAGPCVAMEGCTSAVGISFNGGLSVAPRAIPESQLGKGILEASDPPIRVAWVSCGNPVAMLPDSERVAQALRQVEMTVVVDSHMTDTAREADVILPTTTMLEDDDVVGAFGNHYLGNVRRVVAPPEGVKTEESDRQVTRDWADTHLEIGIASLSEIGQKGETIKHYQY